MCVSLPPPPHLIWELSVIALNRRCYDHYFAECLANFLLLLGPPPTNLHLDLFFSSKSAILKDDSNISCKHHKAAAEHSAVPSSYFSRGHLQ